MIELRVELPDHSTERREFPKTEILIGRKQANDLVLPNAGVSSKHARILVQGDQHFIEDLGSLNGTYLNGQQIRQAMPFNPNDQVVIGEYRLSLWLELEDTFNGLREPPELELSVSREPTPQAPLVPLHTRPELEVEARRSPEIAPPPSSPAAPAPPAWPMGGEVRSTQAAVDTSAQARQAHTHEHSQVRRGRHHAPVPPPQEAPAPLFSSFFEPPAAPRPEATPARPSASAAPQSAAAPARKEAPAASSLPTFRPRPPQSADETGLKRSAIIDLLLKHVYYAGEISGFDLAAAMKLQFNAVLDPIIAELRRDKLLEVKGGGGNFGAVSMVFTLTNKAGDVIRQILDRNRYSGPAPITMDDYLKLVAAQSIRKCKIPKRRLVKEFSHLIVDDYVFDGIGPALNSGTAILFYGPPGNGKTAICQSMVNCIDENILIPYAIEVDGNIIQVFDEHNHKPVQLTEGDTQEFDQRYVLCHRPLIMVGGELELNMLDMSYSADAKYYEAPFQMKANGGILLVDDFGRQKVSPKDLLNRWIVPLESEIDFISLVTGKKLKVPFDVFVAFATNLNPGDLVDDAFLRRVRYKIEVKRPDVDTYRAIFKAICPKFNVSWNEDGFRFLAGLYQRDNRPMNACEPRNLLSAVQSFADYFEARPELSPDLLERAYQSYFTRFQVFKE